MSDITILIAANAQTTTLQQVVGQPAIREGMMTNAGGKICVVTGGTGGIGLAVAESLGASGVELVLIGRDRDKGDAALQRLKWQTPGIAAELYYADLSRLDEVRQLGATLVATLPRIDILINNAGAIFRSRQVTSDGLERTFALNHMAYFLLTELLRERLLASAPARIINVASRMHRGVTLDFDDLQSERHYNGVQAYARSKLCNVLFTRELAKRFRGTGVTANCLHPGFVATGFGNQYGGLFGIGSNVLRRIFGMSPRQAANAVVTLANASELEGVSGAYFNRSRKRSPSRTAQDDSAALRLWHDSARLAGMPHCEALL